MVGSQQRQGHIQELVRGEDASENVGFAAGGRQPTVVGHRWGAHTKFMDQTPVVGQPHGLERGPQPLVLEFGFPCSLLALAIQSTHRHNHTICVHQSPWALTVEQHESPASIHSIALDLKTHDIHVHRFPPWLSPGRRAVRQRPGRRHDAPCSRAGLGGENDVPCSATMPLDYSQGSGERMTFHRIALNSGTTGDGPSDLPILRYSPPERFLHYPTAGLACPPPPALLTAIDRGYSTLRGLWLARRVEFGRIC